jgi:rubredoxin
LNLRLITPEGKIYLGNNFENGWTVLGNSPDNQNNVEGIHLKDPQNGEYQIEIVSTELSSTNLGFAIVVGLDFEINTEPEPPSKIAVIGDYEDQLKTLLQENGHQVESFEDYSDVDPLLYAKIVVNTSSTTIETGPTSIVLLGPYPASSSGIEKYSAAPEELENDWLNGPVKVKVEEEHEKRYRKLLDNIKNGMVFERDEKVRWKCDNCGYVHEGKKAPKKCPACLHDKKYFELKEKNY